MYISLGVKQFSDFCGFPTFSNFRCVFLNPSMMVRDGPRSIPNPLTNYAMRFSYIFKHICLYMFSWLLPCDLVFRLCVSDSVFAALCADRPPPQPQEAGTESPKHRVGNTELETQRRNNETLRTGAIGNNRGNRQEQYPILLFRVFSVICRSF